MSAFSLSKPAFQPGDILSLTNTFDWPGKSYRNEYRVSRGEVATGLEPWLVLALLPAMVDGVDIRLEEAVSPRLLQNLGTVQAIFSDWERARYHKINIEGTPCDPPPVPPEGKLKEKPVAAFFSSGVDSFYTLFKHEAEIGSLVYMQNPYLSAADDAAVTGRIRKIAGLVGKPLVEVLPLVRDFTEPRVNWYFSHGAVMASCALLLAPQFSKVYFASTHSYISVVPWGTHPLLDCLWSTEEVEIVTDGTEASRFQKIEYISQFDEALQNLQVCVWDLPDSEKFNCGECHKCLNTQASLRILGKLDRCPVFAKPLDLEELARHEFDSFYHRTNLLELIEVLDERGGDPPLARALAAALAHQKPVPRYQKLMGTDPELAELRREVETYRTALRYQLTDRVYNLLNKSKVARRTGELLAHGAARLLK